MQVTVEERATHLTVTLVGELDLHAALLLAAQVGDLLPRGLPIALCAARVDFMDTAALTVLQRVQSQARRRCISLDLVDPAPAVQRILALTGVSSWTRSATAPPPA